MKNRITKQGFKICSIRDAYVIGQVKGVCDRVEVSEGQSCPGRDRPQLGLNRQHEVAIKR